MTEKDIDLKDFGANEIIFLSLIMSYDVHNFYSFYYLKYPQGDNE